MEITRRFEASDSSRVGEARRAASELARALGFSAPDTERVSLVVTELMTNLLKHARGGELLVVTGRRRVVPAIDILALDRGPGTDDVSRWIRDGYSTAGSPGTGLGAVVRLSTRMDVYSAAGAGTAVLARVARKTKPGEGEEAPAFEVGGLAVPLNGEQVCGDGWGVRICERGATVVMSDGLGHGPDAALASAEVLRVLHEAADLAPAEMLSSMASELRHTRGAAVAVALLEPHTRTLRFSGVGNIAGVVCSESSPQKSLVSYNGTVGHESPRIRELAYPYPADSVVILHSDGLKTHWKLGDYPGLSRRDPALIAGVLYRDFARGTDDAGIVVVRETRRQAAAGQAEGRHEPS